MLTLLQTIVSPEMYELLEELLPAQVINSFDCARFSMGVAQVTLDLVVVIPQYRRQEFSVEDRVTLLEAHVKHLQACINNIVQVKYIGVWRLGRDESEIKDAWEVAPPLRMRLDKMDSKYGVPDTLLYEFQMGANDKSRMVSTMLAYHYCSRPGYTCTKTVRIPPAVKNTLCPRRALTRAEFMRYCPVTAARRKKDPATGLLKTVADLIYQTKVAKDVAITKDLSIQTFLAIVTDTYDANKFHTAACLEWWAAHFPVDLRYVPADCLDDAADAFIQVLGAIRKHLL